MKPHSTRALVLVLSALLAFEAHAQALEKKTGETKSDENPPAAPCQSANVEIDVSFVSFDPKDIEDMARTNSTAAPTQGQILNAWADGKGSLVASTKVIGLEGRESRSESVIEKLYPTEFEPPRVASAATATAGPWPQESPEPTAGGFQVRNTGLSVVLTPFVSPDHKRVTLTMVPDLSSFLGWSNIDAVLTIDKKVSKVTFTQPDFQARRATTTLVVPMGETVVMAGMPDTTGKLVTYIFVTVHLAQQARTK